MKVENLSTLKIHRLTQSQYNKALLEGRLEENALYLTPEETTADGFATEEYVLNAIENLVDSAPDTLNTLKELSAALNNDADFATTITTELGKKIDKIEGKGLSSNDFTDAYKEKIDAALQDYIETDPTVPGWAKAATKPTYTAAEVGALPNTTVIPTIDSDLSQSGAAADAKVTGDRLHALETRNCGNFFIVVSEDGTCSHTFEQIVSAINNNFNIVAIYNNNFIPLTQYIANELILFYITTFTDGYPIGLFITITPSQNVNITIEQIEIATLNKAGLVKPSIVWSDNMKSPVGIDINGALWFKTDKTLKNENEAADAASIGSEITRLEGLIEEAKTYAGFIVTQDDKGNVVIVAMSPWVVSNSGEDNGNVVITSI